MINDKEDDSTSVDGNLCVSLNKSVQLGDSANEYETLPNERIEDLSLSTASRDFYSNKASNSSSSTFLQVNDQEKSVDCKLDIHVHGESTKKLPESSFAYDESPCSLDPHAGLTVTNPKLDVAIISRRSRYRAG